MAVSEAAIPDSAPAIVETPSPEPREPISETPVETTNNEQQIAKLLSQAATALEEYRLTTPTGSNAYNYYQQILELDSQHEEAITGINRNADAYADLAERKLDKYDYEAADRHLHQGLTIQPENARLQALQKNTNTFRDAPGRLWKKIKLPFS